MSNEEAAKAAWLANLDKPSWGEQGVTQPATEPSAVPNEEAAKAAWLAKLDKPSWGKAAKVLTVAAAEATAMAQLSTDCQAGDSTACKTLSNEEAAKRKWLAKLDTTTPTARSHSDSPAVPTTEPSVDTYELVTGVSMASPTPVVNFDNSAHSDGLVQVENTASEPRFTKSQMLVEMAKRAWSAKIDSPTWGQTANALRAAAVEATLMAGVPVERTSGSSSNANDALSNDEEASRAWAAWLARGVRSAETRAAHRAAKMAGFKQ